MRPSVNIKFMGHALTIFGEFIPGEKQERFYPGTPASFEVHDVFIEGHPDDVAELLNPYEDELAELALKAFMEDQAEAAVYRALERAA